MHLQAAAPRTHLGAKVRCSGDIVRTLESYCSPIFAAEAGGERTAHWAGLAQFLRKEIGADSAPSFDADLDTKNQSGIVKTYNEFENIDDLISIEEPLEISIKFKIVIFLK